MLSDSLKLNEGLQLNLKYFEIILETLESSMQNHFLSFCNLVLNFMNKSRIQTKRLKRAMNIHVILVFLNVGFSSYQNTFTMIYLNLSIYVIHFVI